MLPRGAVMGGVVVVVVAFYCKLYNVQLLRDEAVLLQQLKQSHRQAQEPVLLMFGRGFFFIAAAAWAVLGLQSVVTAIQRASYKPTVRRPLQPLTEEQQQQSQDQQGASSSSAAAAPASASRTAPTRAPEQDEADWREERRWAALEARQRELDQQTAALKEQQAALKQQQAARRAQAAEAAARKKAEQAAAEAKARAETEAARAAFVAEAARRREAAARATQDQWLGLTPPGPTDNTADEPRHSRNSSSAGGGQRASSSSSQQANNNSTPPAGSSAPSQQQQPQVAASSGNTQLGGDLNADRAAAAAPAGGIAAGSGEVSLDDDLYGDGTTAGVALDRQLRQEQDREYQQSLERDRAKAAARAAERKAAAAALKQQGERQRLSALRASLLAGLAPEPSSDADGVLTIRVRLPGGSQAVRRFSPSQGFEDVFAWVYSLSDMPLWAPGSWALISAFPRRQLAPPSGSSWAPSAGLQQQEAEEAGEEQLLLPGEWMLQVNQLTEGPLFVRVHDDTTLQEVQTDVAAQIGVNPSQQRLIFSGQILQQPYRTLKQLKIAPGHTLQLAVRGMSAGGSSTSSSGGGTDPFLAAAATAERARELGKAAEHAFLGSGDVLEVSTVEQLQADVAHGASQLALYVEALQTTA